MKQLLKKLAAWLYSYGVWGAGVPSYHGICEPPVPTEPQNVK